MARSDDGLTMANREPLSDSPPTSTRLPRGVLRLIMLVLLAPMLAAAATPRDSLPGESLIPRNKDTGTRAEPVPEAPEPPRNRPHILYVTADDLGRQDVGYHGSTIRTPTIDRLAKEGARLEHFYVQPFSGQTRAAALTGRYPMRYGLQTLQIQWFSEFALPEDEELLPKMLKEAGYRTVLIGKWHLGQVRKEDQPNARGYDMFYGHLGGAIDQDKKTDAGGRPDWWRNDKRVKEDGYATTLLAREAAAVIAKHERAQPLFLHLSLSAPQAPLSATKPYTGYYTGGDPQLRTYRAMVSAVDGVLEQTIKALDKRGMLKDTLLVFHAGSGGAVKRKHPIGDGEATANVASNGPFKGGSGGLHEGGMRAVAFVWWPGQVLRNVVNELLHVVDLYPTLLRLAQAAPRQTKPLDGLDVWETIAQGKESPRKEALLSVDEFRGALRMGEWKLIQHATLPGKVELYNLSTDPSEADNLAERDPERLRAMQKRLTEYAWDMAPSRYLEELASPRKVKAPIYWGENPVRP
ncbi:MAG: arylsulfatase B [Burkholderiales bacterium]